MWYILNLAAQDEMTQKKGIVGVWWMMGSMNQSHQEGRRNAASVSQMKSALPIHTSVAHVCLSDPIMSKYVSFALLFQSRAKRVRVKAHGGKELIWYCCFLKPLFTDEERTCRCSLAPAAVPSMSFNFSLYTRHPPRGHVCAHVLWNCAKDFTYR